MIHGMESNYSMDWDKMRSDPYLEGREDWYYRMLSYTKIIGAVNLICQLYFVVRIAYSTALHINFRISVCNTIISLELMSLTEGLAHFYNDYTVFIEPRFWPNVGCIAVGVINNIAVFGSASAMFMLALERHLAYRLVDVYEEKPNTLGCALGTIVVLQSSICGAALWCYFVVYLSRFDVYTSRLGCAATDVTWQWQFGAYVLAFGSCAAGLVWVRILSRRAKLSKKTRLNLKNLSARYQATENYQTMCSIYRSMFFYLLLTVVGITSGALRGYVVYHHGENTISSRMLVTVSHIYDFIYLII
ncbi:unnamed protein product [Bursaphelenchus xylophilus]|uniref:(pine wood nematode) hypothetical protein n=1 Tax=Bursaphelenchus xylophilus TaxID=6326 RepID=A0A7I8X567_BURXY|nr:unnamed protein product [Bursaphelenchus xylophilus]CAG9122433.1 unnamed protein product [Bursaphelenchus xylophilus]